jgi:hypothetical protein
MGTVLAIVKEFLAMPLVEIEALPESSVHEARAGACSVMGKAATHKKVTAERHEGLVELYLRRHDRIDDWDLVDLVAYQVLGTWLLERPRDVLHELAGSDSWPERHTAIVATRRLPRPRAGPRHPRHQPSPRGRRPSVGAEGRRLDAVFAQPKSRPIDKKTDYDDWTRLPRSAGVRLHTAGTRPPRCC